MADQLSSADDEPSEKPAPAMSRGPPIPEDRFDAAAWHAVGNRLGSALRGLEDDVESDGNEDVAGWRSLGGRLATTIGVLALASAHHGPEDAVESDGDEDADDRMESVAGW